MPADVAKFRREHVEALVADLLAHKAPATAHNRYRGCQAFFSWAQEEGEVKESPMACESRRPDPERIYHAAPPDRPIRRPPA